MDYSVPVARWVDDVARLHNTYQDTKAVTNSHMVTARRAEYLVKVWFRRNISYLIEVALDMRVNGESYMVYPGGRRVKASKSNIDIPRYGVDIKSGNSIRQSELAHANYIVNVPDVTEKNGLWVASPRFATNRDINSAARWELDRFGNPWYFTYINDDMNWKPLYEFGRS